MQKVASMRSLVLITLVIGLVVSCEAFTWEPCDVENVVFTPDQVTLEPDPPAAGGSVTFKIMGTAPEHPEVPSGLISINVSFAGTQIYEEVDDLCSKTSCPLKTGPIEVTYVQDLPPIAPPGDYDVQVVARGLDNEELMCVVVHFEMLPPSFIQHMLPSSWLGKKGSQAQHISVVPAVARRLLRRFF